MEKKLKYYKYQMNTLTINVIAILIFIVLDIFVSYTFKGSVDTLKTFHFIIVIFWLILHELLHYLGFLICREAKPENLLLGMRIEKGIFYCMCKRPISKKNILIALNFPLFFIGILTLVMGYLFNSMPLIFLSLVNIAGASGDILMTIQMLKMPKGIKYVDGDDSIGYYILSEEDISNIKVPSLKLMESGLCESDKLLSKDKRKIIISKMSYLFLVIYAISCALLIFID